MALKAVPKVRPNILVIWGDHDKYPYQAGTSLKAAGSNYQTVKMADALKRLGKVEGFALAARN